MACGIVLVLHLFEYLWEVRVDTLLAESWSVGVPLGRVVWARFHLGVVRIRLRP